MCIYVGWQIYDNVSSSRDVCLETVTRIRNYQGKCYFDFSTAKNIIQDGRLLKVIFINVANDSLNFKFYIELFYYDYFVKDVQIINYNRMTFEIV